MKNLLCVITLVTINYISGQESLSYEKVIQVDGVSKDKIYDAIKSYLVDAFDVNTRRFDLEDRAAGMIKVSAAYDYRTHSFGCFDGDIDYKLKIEVREGRYKVWVGNFYHRSGCGLWDIDTREVYQTKGLEKKMNNREWPYVQKSTSTFANTFFESIKNATDKAALNNDW